MEMEDFYSYKNFGKEFNESFYIDIEKSIHTVPLYLVWAEKCSFLKKAIINNHRDLRNFSKKFSNSYLKKKFSILDQNILLKEKNINNL
jgi:hypothetical protein